MEVTLNKIPTTAIAATAALALAGLFSEAQAQTSGDVVRIGFITDMSGVYADVDGPAGADAIKMAIADFGGSVNGKKIEFISADHQNKADIAASKAREWFRTLDVGAAIEQPPRSEFDASERSV